MVLHLIKCIISDNTLLLLSCVWTTERLFNTHKKQSVSCPNVEVEEFPLLPPLLLFFSFCVCLSHTQTQMSRMGGVMQYDIAAQKQRLAWTQKVAGISAKTFGCL